MSSPNIAIVGAGPAGLMLARILHHKAPSTFRITVFEAEESATARSQGGTLDLRPESGQHALKEAGLFDQFQQNARYEGEDFILADKTGKKHIEIIDQTSGRPEIDRIKLREILLTSCPEGMIRWGKRIKSVTTAKRLEFEDGTTEGGFDLVVGADGAWSRVRPLLTNISPFYSGISGFDIQVVDAKDRHPQISAMVGRGSYFAFGGDDKQCMLYQVNGDGSLRCYLFASKPESWIKDPDCDFQDQEAVRDALRRDYAHYSPELQRVIRAFDTTAGDKVTPRAFYMLPVGLTWPSLPGITVVGDAAHLMTPFAGEGVNQALQDSAELATAILRTPQDLASAAAEYEREMFPRAKTYTQETWEALLSFFGPNAIADFKNMFRELLETLETSTGDEGGPPSAQRRVFFAED